MMGRAISQLVGLRPSMGGSVILTHWGSGTFERVTFLMEGVIRLVEGLLMVRDEMAR